MHPNVTRACEILQLRLSRLQSQDYYFAERAELALNELVSHPELTDPPSHLIRNAMSNARKKLMRRVQLMDEFSPMLTFGVDREFHDDIPELEQQLAAVSAALPERDSCLLEAAALTEDTRELATVLQLPVERTRERLSRARARALIAWKDAA